MKSVTKRIACALGAVVMMLAFTAPVFASSARATTWLSFSTAAVT